MLNVIQVVLLFWKAPLRWETRTGSRALFTNRGKLEAASNFVRSLERSIIFFYYWDFLSLRW